MPITDAQWDAFSGTYDIHAMEGHSTPSLLDVLQVRDTAGTWVRASAAAGVRFEFVGLYRGARGAHGVDVDPATGAITVAQPRPTPKLHSFRLRVRVTDTSVTPNRDFDPGRVRVYVHESVRSVWLTPSALTIRQGANGQRFSVLAIFDSGVWGDISRHPGHRWAPVAGSGRGITVNPTTGDLTATSPAGRLTVELTPAAMYGSSRARADVASIGPWSTPVAATLVSGPGRAAMARIPNILFLPDGFEAADRGAFDRMITEAVHFFTQTYAPRPYNLIGRRINFWKAWVASPQRGCSVLSAVRWWGLGTQFRGEELPSPVSLPTPAPTPAPTPWGVEHLIEVAGYPRGDQLLTPFATAMAEWDALYQPRIAGHITPQVFANWAQLGVRIFAEERDTAFGIAFGGRPVYDIDEDFPPRNVEFHPFRTTRAHIDPMLSNLTDGSGGPTIGAVWGSRTGKDRKLVVFLCGGPRYGGTQLPEDPPPAPPAALIAASVDPDNSDVSLRWIGPPAGRADLVPSTPSSWRAGDPLGALVMHELGHALGLGDEYGTRLGPPPSPPVTADYPNLQDAASAQVGGRLVGARIRWRYPRVEKAAVLVTARAVGSDFELEIEAMPVWPFGAGDVIRVRRRSLVGGVVQSNRLVVRNVTGRVISAGVVSGSSFSPGAWPAGSVVMRPLINPAIPTEDLTLVSPIIEAHVTSTGGPLDAPRAAPLRTCAVDDRAIQPPRNRPPTLARQYRTPALVGIYEGGAEWHCGVYHPAGECLMRDNDQLRTLCHVCRYLIVDALDPTKHTEANWVYEALYPR